MRLRQVLCLIALLTPAVADAQKRCVRGIPCGNTCIAATRTCRIDGGGARDGGSATSEPPPAATRAPAAVPPAGARWVASSRGSVYYRIGCSGANRLAVANRIYFPTEAAAQAAGYRRSRTNGC